MNHPKPAANRPAARFAMAAGVQRVFFALWPDAGARDALAMLARAVAGQAGGRAPRAENLHLTLAFVGEVAVERVEALRAAGVAAAAGIPAFDLALDRLGAFRGAGIAWVGASAIPAELEQLVQLLTGALAKEGFPVERRAFHPHVTLARRCRRAAGVGIAAPIAWTVDRLALNASETLPEGPRYRALADWPLDGRDRPSRA